MRPILNKQARDVEASQAGEREAKELFFISGSKFHTPTDARVRDLKLRDEIAKVVEVELSSQAGELPGAELERGGIADAVAEALEVGQLDVFHGTDEEASSSQSRLH